MLLRERLDIIEIAKPFRELKTWKAFFIGNLFKLEKKVKVTMGNTSSYTNTVRTAWMPREISALSDNLWGNRGINMSIKTDIYIFVLPGKGRIP